MVYIFRDDDVRRLKDLLSMDAVMVGGPPHNWWLSGNDEYLEGTWTFLSGRPVPESGRLPFHYTWN